ncbi:MAG TPA: tetratricopeptide repeat protein [Gemmatimonadaceae bacterium]|nr:tetratricopeptide repeat protein [Gemmatimonadaceae bacterium]
MRRARSRSSARFFRATLACVLLAGVARVSLGQAPGHDGHSLGVVDFPVSCSAGVRPAFDRAVALLHHMTYPEARKAFELVAATDPTCAMAQWGIAMTLFQPLWPTRPGPDALRRGWNAVEKADAIGVPTERERLFVAAAEAFFLEPASTDYWLRIRRWAHSSEQLYSAFPNDDDAASFYALALLATAPADTASRVNADSAAAILLRVYARNPRHPGAIHYFIHADDVPGRERESLAIVRSYDAIAPRNPHALHMPTHIYTRLGDWDAVVRGNLEAANAALEYRAGDSGQFVWDEFPHAIEYLVYAYLQQGRDEAAADQIRRLRATPRLEPTFKTAFHLSSTQARYALERRDWNHAAAIVPRQPSTISWDRFAWPEAISWFARGLGAAHLGRIDEARQSADRLDVLDSASGKAGETLFARNVRVLRLELRAWIAHVAGQCDSSAQLMNEAVVLEAATPKAAVTPAPTLPAQELLGDMLVEQGRSSEALAAYRRALELYPNRFNSLLGAARAARAAGDTAQARTLYGQLLTVAKGGTRRPALREAQRFGDQRR